MTHAPLMAGKKGLVMGVANDRSIAWAIAKTVHEHGGEVALTYQGEALQKRIGPLARSIGAELVLPCDVMDDGSLAAVFETLGKTWGQLDFVVHAIAYSDKEQLKGRYVETTAQNFSETMLVSCYSFTAVCQRAGETDVGRRQLAHPDLHGRRAGDAALQRHGRRQGGA